MARSTLAVQTVVRGGITPAYTAADVEGHKVANDGHVILHIKNTDVAPCTVTIETPGTVDTTLGIADRTVVVADTAGDVMIGPFPINVYNQTGSLLFVDFSNITALTIAAIKVP